MRWVYSVGTQKPAIRSPVRPTANFFTSIFGFGTPRRTPSPLPQSEKKLNLLDVNVVNVTLEILTADVNVNLDRKMKEALHRSTKKNPPSRLKYELIYVSEPASASLPLIACFVDRQGRVRRKYKRG
jgi:hypothetical protein